ncbi:MAG TPA: pseudouridine synthase [Oligoflexia bacterium]|nr:pseudouridine synthase [Oligoflexia bacterium]HMP27132.1 pseudouridine synthase [Oligoflexia bacterium]
MKNKGSLFKLLANLGYCSRKEAPSFILEHQVIFKNKKIFENCDLVPDSVDNEPLDPLFPLTIAIDKPVGYVCSRSHSEGCAIYDLLPPRFLRRTPLLAPVGRLDRDTSGILLLTDDGQLNHLLTSPKNHLPRVYHVKLERPLKTSAATLLTEGKLILNGENKPLKPAKLEIINQQECYLTIYEGKHHQVKRMFEATNNQVTDLRRIKFGNLSVTTISDGKFKILSAEEIKNLVATEAHAQSV